MTENLMRLLNHARERPEIVLAFAFGCVCGLLLRLPLFPWKLSNDASTVVGAALGALIGAGAAAVIASGIANRSDQIAKATVAAVIQEPLNILVEMVVASENHNPFYHEIAGQITALKDKANQAGERLRILSASDRFVSGMAGVAIVDAMLAMESIQKRTGAMGQIVGIAMGANRNSIYSMPQDTRTSLNADIAKLRGALSFLGHA